VLSVGALLYVALADMIPEVHENNHHRLDYVTFGFFVFGIFSSLDRSCTWSRGSVFNLDGVAWLSHDNVMKKTLVIIGGGYTSLDLYNRLKNKFEITILEPRSEFYHYIGMLRGVVNPDFDKVLRHSYRVFDGAVVKDCAEKIDMEKRFVVGEHGQKYPFDYLVIASGVQHPIRSFPHLSESIKAAQTIVIQGGGPIGIELAGEITTFYPEKKIYISHTDKLLLSKLYQLSFRQKLTDLATHHGIELISPHHIEEKHADLVVPCFGFTPNSSFVPQDWLSDKGYVKVDHELEVVGTTNIFAMGDIADLKESKQLINGWEHTKVLAYNLTHEMKKPYIGVKNDMIAIPFGPQKGYTFLPYLGGIVLGGWVTSFVKGRSLLVDRISRLFS
jgi:apoptosis-inducing factor 2